MSENRTANTMYEDNFVWSYHKNSIRKHPSYAKGLYLGYPLCCVLAYVARTVHYPLPYVNPMHGTGFVPCQSCAEKYTSEELINKINSQRLYQHSFPEENLVHEIYMTGFYEFKNTIENPKNIRNYNE